MLSTTVSYFDVEYLSIEYLSVEYLSEEYLSWISLIGNRFEVELGREVVASDEEMRWEDGVEVVRLRRSEVELVWELLFDVLDAEYLEEGRVDDWRVDLVLSEEVVPPEVSLELREPVSNIESRELSREEVEVP